jgi:adenylate kinase family enzyme
MRVVVVGTSGAGKSTFARRLSSLAGIPHVELDAINWQEDWHSLALDDPKEFRRRVAHATSAEAWIIDGNYSVARDLTLGRATHLVWLDYSRWLTMRRVVRRSFDRTISGRELWPGTGNREHFSRWLRKDHPIRWAWNTYDRRQRDIAALFDDPALAHIAKHRVRTPDVAEGLLAQWTTGA